MKNIELFPYFNSLCPKVTYKRPTNTVPLNLPDRNISGYIAELQISLKIWYIYLAIQHDDLSIGCWADKSSLSLFTFKIWMQDFKSRLLLPCGINQFTINSYKLYCRIFFFWVAYFFLLPLSITNTPSYRKDGNKARQCLSAGPQITKSAAE